MKIFCFVIDNYSFKEQFGLVYLFTIRRKYLNQKKKPFCRDWHIYFDYDIVGMILNWIGLILDKIRAKIIIWKERYRDYKYRNSFRWRKFSIDDFYKMRHDCYFQHEINHWWDGIWRCKLKVPYIIPTQLWHRIK